LIAFELPLQTPSTANLREHWAAKAKRTKSQRRAVFLKCPPWPGPALLVVHIVRVGPRLLDSDNLQTAMKGIRDSVAARLGIDDGSRLVRWTYDQTHGDKPSVRVFIATDRPRDSCEHSIGTDDVCGRCK
jgi:hypothetical protein